MSWNAWVDPLISAGRVQQAGIYGIDGAPWVQAGGINASAAEIKTIVSGTGNPGAFSSSGVVVGGVKYMFLRTENAAVPFVYGKKGAGGMAAYKTSKAIIIGVYDENGNAGTCNSAIGAQADALIAAGF